MMSGYRVLQRNELDKTSDFVRDFSLDVLLGLSEANKSIDSRYFYDDEGSRLFQDIMNCEEYYPTSCESEILEKYGRQMIETCGSGPLNIVDLGAGDGAKTKILLRTLSEMGANYRYVPIDLSEAAIAGLVQTVMEEFPGIDVQGLVCDYSDGLDWLSGHDSSRRNLLLFLGSNIGNFNRSRARAFLRRQWNSLCDGDFVLIGFDLKKNIDVLLRAYNDEEGITSEFNLNLLARINKELGGHFRTQDFRHYGTYDVFSGAMVSYLVSLKQQTVEIESLGKSFQFDAWEAIHTEYSYKYLESDIISLAKDTGYVLTKSYSDDRNYFVDSVWRVQK